MTYEFKVGDEVEYVGNTKNLTKINCIIGKKFIVHKIVKIGEISNYWYSDKIYKDNSTFYWAHNLALSHKPYDPNQIGDLEDDI